MAMRQDLSGTISGLALATVALMAATPAAAAETVTYTYDVHGRLVKVERQRDAADETTTDYGHDQADNRTRKKVTVTPD
jgi:hypothetical protein